MMIRSLILFILSFLGAASLTARSASHPALLQGSTQDSTINDIGLGHSSPFWKNLVAPTFLLRENREADYTFRLQVQVEEPKPMTFFIQGKSVSIYVHPADSVRFTIQPENGKLRVIFKGKNEAYYNFFEQLDEKASPQTPYPAFSKGQDLQEYKAAIDTWYERRDAFKRTYMQKHKLSAAFARYASEELQSEYLSLLYRPMAEELVKPDDLPAGYFTLANSMGKPDERVPYFSKRRMNAMTYRYILDQTVNPWENFDSIYANIKKNFRGSVREHLIANLIGVFAKKQLQTYRFSLQRAIEEAPNFVSDASCLAYINQSAEQYLLLNQLFPQDLLTSTLLRSYTSSKLVTLAGLLDTYKGQAVYIDLWASWCSPCIQHILQSDESRVYLESQGVKYIFLSLDTKANTEKWLKASDKYKITGDQYLLAGDFSSPLARHLKVSSIPRYILLNRLHEVKDIDAPHPTPADGKKLKKVVEGALKDKVPIN